MKRIVFLSFIYCQFIYAQPAKDICGFVPRNCERCCGANDIDDVVHLQIPYLQTGTPKNSLKKAGYQLVFYDEFAVKGQLDTVHTAITPTFYYLTSKGKTYPKWVCTTDSNAVRGSGGGGKCNEAVASQVFIAPNDSLGEDGKLMIQTTRNEGDSECKERYKIPVFAMNGRIRYGYAEAKIKVPKGVGLWPSFVWWAPGWQYQEIDVFEFFQNGKGAVDGCNNSLGHQAKTGKTWAYHTGIFFDADGSPDIQSPKDSFTSRGVIFTPILGSCGQFRGQYQQVDMSKDFFLYAVEWTPDSVYFYCNNVLYWRQPHKMTTQPMQITFCVNINKPNGGLPNAYTPMVNTMEMDYLRVYKKDNQAEFDRIFDGFPTEFKQGSEGHFSLNDHFTMANYEFEVVNARNEKMPNCTITPQYEGDGTPWRSNGLVYHSAYGMYFHYTFPPNIPTGDYRLKLTLSLPNGEGGYVQKEVFRAFTIK